MPRVLIIEDDAENRRVLAELFAREDWKVLEAKDGDAGLELALRNRPELILCDLLMPKSNGFEVCRSIREQLLPTKIIVVSGRDYGVDRTSALEAGADEYLLKPITWELLSSTIDRLLPEIPRRPEPKSVPERESGPARIRLWGVRGSIPVPGKSTVRYGGNTSCVTVRYGGNTSCVEVRADGEIIILDAGTGIRLLGLALDKEFGPRSMKLTLLISHTHWDHIQGLPFFSPAYNQKNLIRVLGYEGARAGLAKILASQMETPFFPVSLRQLPSHLAIEELRDMEFQVGTVEVRSKFANHPGICVGYRLATSSGSIAYFPDNEPYEELPQARDQSPTFPTMNHTRNSSCYWPRAMESARTKRGILPLPSAERWSNFSGIATWQSWTRNIPTRNTRSTLAGATAQWTAWFRWPLMQTWPSSCFSITIRIMTTR